MRRTRASIIAAFSQLLEERPLNKITVKDIVDRCDINRNTFYYHFQDIPALLQEMMEEKESIMDIRMFV
jgi:AcrR family transcriptional regulator